MDFKIADFEILTNCLCLNSSQMFTYFCKDLVTGYCLYLVKSSIPKRHPFLTLFQPGFFGFV